MRQGMHPRFALRSPLSPLRGGSCRGAPLRDDPRSLPCSAPLVRVARGSAFQRMCCVAGSTGVGDKGGGGRGGAVEVQADGAQELGRCAPWACILV